MHEKTGVAMRLAIVSALLAFLLLLPGCTGSQGDVPLPPEQNAGATWANAPTMPAIRIEQPFSPPLPPEKPQAPEPFIPFEGEFAAPSQEYSGYCSPTHWIGALEGAGHNQYENGYCGEYDYAVKISVQFAVPFDMAAYLAGEDFDFGRCYPRSADGIPDISIDGIFRSERNITSAVSKEEFWRPDRQTLSNGAIYAVRSGGQMAIVPYIGAKTGGKKGGYAHLVAIRCTSLNGYFETGGYDEAMLLGEKDGGFAASSDSKTLRGRWTMNGTLMGNYTLIRAN